MHRKLSAIYATLCLSASSAFAQAPAGFTKVASAISALSFTDSSCPNQTTCEYIVTTVDSAGVESAPAACAAGQLCVNGNIAVAEMPSSGVHTVAVSWVASPTAGALYNVYVHVGPLPASGVKTTVQ